MVPKLNLKYGERVRVKKTGTPTDGTEFVVIGLVSRHIFDTYIIQLSGITTRTMPDFGEYSALAMWEACLERVD